jgi:hypothetical protein
VPQNFVSSLKLGKREREREKGGFSQFWQCPFEWLVALFGLWSENLRSIPHREDKAKNLSFK